MKIQGLRSNFELPTDKTEVSQYYDTQYAKPQDKTDVVIQLLSEILENLSRTNDNLIDRSSSNSTAITTAPELESSLYTREKINTLLGHNAETLYTYNAGPGTWYVRVSNDGKSFANEFEVYEGESKAFSNVFELRHRSETAGMKFRLSEHEIRQQTAVSRGEKIEIYSSDKDVHFTDAIAMNAMEDENITGLTGNRFTIRDINIQSKQPLIYRIIFWSSDTFDDTNLNTDSFLDSVMLDMTVAPAFRINNTGQYYYSSGDLEVLYEDLDNTKELHVSLQNTSAVAKIAGANGEVQIDFRMSPRL